MKEEPTRDGGIRWMSWVLDRSKNVQRTDDPVVGVKYIFFKFYTFFKKYVD